MQFQEISNIFNSGQKLRIVEIIFAAGLLWNQLWLRLRISICVQNSNNLQIDGTDSSWILFLPRFNNIISHSREAFNDSQIFIVFSSPIKFPYKFNSSITLSASFKNKNCL